MRNPVSLYLAVAVIAALHTGCQTAPKTQSDKDELHNEVKIAIMRFKDKDPGMDQFFSSAKGYAVFPSVGKGGFIVGGAYGKGELYEKGKMVGHCDLSQGSIGAQIGGQGYREIIFFETTTALASFKSGTFEFAGQASAVAAAAGASADADYEHGVAVFTMARGGLMAEASIGGQNFSYQAK